MQLGTRQQGDHTATGTDLTEVVTVNDERDGQALNVKRLAVAVPITAEQLLDAGLPLSPGMEPPAASPPMPRHVRWRLAWAEWVWNTRTRLGFWIAGHEPDEGGW
jgi:hypothetical protein